MISSSTRTRPRSSRCARRQIVSANGPDNMRTFWPISRPSSRRTAPRLSDAAINASTTPGGTGVGRSAPVINEATPNVPLMLRQRCLEILYKCGTCINISHSNPASCVGIAIIIASSLVLIPPPLAINAALMLTRSRLTPRVLYLNILLVSATYLSQTYTALLTIFYLTLSHRRLCASD